MISLSRLEDMVKGCMVLTDYYVIKCLSSSFISDAYPIQLSNLSAAKFLRCFIFLIAKRYRKILNLFNFLSSLKIEKNSMTV